MVFCVAHHHELHVIVFIAGGNKTMATATNAVEHHLRSVLQGLGRKVTPHHREYDPIRVQRAIRTAIHSFKE